MKRNMTSTPDKPSVSSLPQQLVMIGIRVFHLIFAVLRNLDYFNEGKLV